MAKCFKVEFCVTFSSKQFNGFFLFLALVAILFSGANNFSNFGRRLSKEHLCEIILKSVYWSRRKYHLKVFLFLTLAAILLSETEPF